MKLTTLLTVVLFAAILVPSPLEAGGGSGNKPEPDYERGGSYPDFGELEQAPQQVSPRMLPNRPAPRAAVTPASGRPRVIFLGDSLTRGPGLAPAETYPALLQKKMDSLGLKYEVVNAGVNGNTSGNGLARIEKEMKDGAAVVVVALGTNDANILLAKGHDKNKEGPAAAARLKQNLERIAVAVKAQKAKLVVVGVRLQSWHGKALTEGFAAAFQSVAEAHKAPLVPGMLDGVWGKSKLWLSNGHPNAAGQAVMALTVWKGLEPVVLDFGRQGR